MTPRVKIVSPKTFKKWFSKTGCWNVKRGEYSLKSYADTHGIVGSVAYRLFYETCHHFYSLLYYLSEKCIVGAIHPYPQYVFSYAPHLQVAFYGVDTRFFKKVIIPWLEKWQHTYRSDAPCIMTWYNPKGTRNYDALPPSAPIYGLSAVLSEKEISDLKLAFENKFKQNRIGV